MGRDLVWLSGAIKTPPFSAQARHEAGLLLRRLQYGESLSMPHSRRMPTIGPRCHELRIHDKDDIWRIVYRLDEDAILILEVFEKRSRRTPHRVIDNCKKRIRDFDST